MILYWPEVKLVGTTMSCFPERRLKSLASSIQGDAARWLNVKSNDRQNTDDSYSYLGKPSRYERHSRYFWEHCQFPLDHRDFSTEDLLARRYYIPLYSLSLSGRPDCGFVGGDDVGGEDIELSSGYKQWRSLNSKEESEKSEEEEIHWEKALWKEGNETTSLSMRLI